MLLFGFSVPLVSQACESTWPVSPGMQAQAYGQIAGNRTLFEMLGVRASPERMGSRTPLPSCWQCCAGAELSHVFVSLLQHAVQPAAR